MVGLRISSAARTAAVAGILGLVGCVGAFGQGMNRQGDSGSTLWQAGQGQSPLWSAGQGQSPLASATQPQYNYQHPVVTESRPTQQPVVQQSAPVYTPKPWYDDDHYQRGDPAVENPGRVVTGRVDTTKPDPARPEFTATYSGGSQNNTQNVRDDRGFHDPGHDGDRDQRHFFPPSSVFISGFFYGNYCASPVYACTYPSVYSNYYGLPEYISTPGVIVLSDPYCPDYVTPYQSFDPGATVYNTTNNYYLEEANPNNATDTPQDSGDSSQHPSFAPGTYQAAFVDIENSWMDGNLDLLTGHLRDTASKVDVSLDGKYAYTLSSDDFAQITHDAFANINTVSFKFSRLRKASNGDVTAYGKHVYVPDAVGSEDSNSSTVPFDQPDNSPSAQTGEASDQKTVYVSFTLHNQDDQWYIIAVDSSTSPLVPDQDQ